MKIKAILLLSLTLFSSTCFAWDAMGHRIIAEIAYEKLDNKAQQRTTELVEYLANAYPYSSTFQTASTWMDTIREDGVNIFNDWHFINTPFSDDQTPTQSASSANIVWAINQSIAVLQNPKSNQFEKALFLRYLLHLVGDAHQPLHCANYFSINFPQGDQGGNLFILSEDSYNNLHAYWDDGLGLFDQQCAYHLTKSRQAKCLATKIMQDYPPSFFGKQLTDANPEAWVNESFIIAKDFAYQTSENKRLSKAYIQQGQQVVEQRLALAGYRLAAILNNLFG